MKKKSLAFLLIVVLIFGLFSGCKNTRPENNIIESQNSESEALETKESANNADINSDEQNEEIEGGVIELRKYRMCYYNIPAPFAKLVGREVSYEWEIEYGKTHNVILSDRMLMVDFIKEFNISKEDFERANLELAKFWTRNGESIFRVPKDYANQEFKEIYNADIIYTFDDEIINAYYLGFDYPYIYDVEFEEAVANGEYTSQTEEWVDVEQMEAEIIAKYGEAEQVTTETVTE